jgi:hypothetical protein
MRQNQLEAMAGSMNNLSGYAGDSFNPVAVNNLPLAAKRTIKHEGGMVAAKTVIATLYEQGGAHLANVALENVGALSAMEAHLTRVAPSGAGRYRAIVDAFTLGAANRIARW